jgi:hypothetical protein
MRFGKNNKGISYINKVHTFRNLAGGQPDSSKYYSGFGRFGNLPGITMDSGSIVPHSA